MRLIGGGILAICTILGAFDAFGVAQWNAMAARLAANNVPLTVQHTVRSKEVDQVMAFEEPDLSRLLRSQGGDFRKQFPSNSPNLENPKFQTALKSYLLPFQAVLAQYQITKDVPVHFGYDYSLGPNLRLPEVQAYHALTRLYCADAVSQIANGKTDAALKDLRSAMIYGNHVGDMRLAIGALASEGIQSHVVDVLGLLAEKHSQNPAVLAQCLELLKLRREGSFEEKLQTELSCQAGYFVNHPMDSGFLQGALGSQDSCVFNMHGRIPGLHDYWLSQHVSSELDALQYQRAYHPTVPYGFQGQASHLPGIFQDGLGWDAIWGHILSLSNLNMKMKALEMFVNAVQLQGKSSAEAKGALIRLQNTMDPATGRNFTVDVHGNGVLVKEVEPYPGSIRPPVTISVFPIAWPQSPPYELRSGMINTPVNEDDIF